MNKSKIDLIVSRAALTARLINEGRWEDASDYRNVIINERRINGRTGSLVEDESWRAMEKEFPPLDPEPEEEFTEEDVAGTEIPEPENEKINRSEIARRLIRAGLWGEAQQWKNARIRELREQGKEQAWVEMAQRYPPSAKTGLPKK